VLENTRVHDQTAGISDLLTSVVLASGSQAEQRTMRVCATSVAQPLELVQQRHPSEETF